MDGRVSWAERTIAETLRPQWAACWVSVTRVFSQFHLSSSLVCLPILFYSAYCIAMIHSEKLGWLLSQVVYLLTCLWWFATPWTITHSAPCFMGFSSMITGVGCHYFLHGIFLTQDWTHGSYMGRQVLYHWATWEALYLICLVSTWYI